MRIQRCCDDRLNPGSTSSFVTSSGSPRQDRLCRDAQDVGATTKAFASRKIEVIVLQLGKLDLASPAGKMVRTMLAAAVAEMERDLLVEQTQA
jgi:DNA invertase Pin-like site-specific DNA recombinase